MIDPLERVVRPIVEGQIRGFVKEHPSVLEGVTWYRGHRNDQTETLVNSLAKRIIRDLTCPTVRARLAAALLQPTGGEPSSDVLAGLTGASTAGPGIVTGAGGEGGS